MANATVLPFVVLAVKLASIETCGEGGVEAIHGHGGGVRGGAGEKMQ